MDKMLSKEISCLDYIIREYVSRDHDFKRMFNMTQFHIIMFLIKSDKDVNQKDLEIETGLKKASITGIIDTLSEKGFVERVKAEDDRRKNYIRLTQKSLDLKKEIEHNVKEINEIMTKGISQEELNHFYDVIERIKENIADRL